MLYDLVRGLRLLIRARNAAVIVIDVLFFAVSGAITFLFALPFNKGSVRGFILFGEAVGFLAYRLTLGQIMGRFYAFLASKIQRIVQKIRKIIEKIFDLVLKAVSFIVYNINVVIYNLRRKHAEKAAEKRKKRIDKASAGENRRSHKDRKHESEKNKKAAVRGRYKGRKKVGTQKRR